MRRAIWGAALRHKQSTRSMKTQEFGWSEDRGWMCPCCQGEGFRPVHWRSTRQASCRRDAASEFLVAQLRRAGQHWAVEWPTLYVREQQPGARCTNFKL
eukprot:272164-Pleurochrysis_carterae.AAC.1